MPTSGKTDCILQNVALGATGFLIGSLFLAIAFAAAGYSQGHDAECPPLIEASTKLRLYFDEPPPELTDADREFAELCGVGDWSDPFREAPPEDGGA